MIEFCILWRSRSIRVPMCSQNRFYWLQLINYHILSLAELNDTSFAFRSDEFAKKRRRLMLKPTKQYRQVFGTIQSIAWRDEQLYGKLQFRYLEGTSVTSCKLACETIWKHISSKRLDWRKIAYINNFKWIKWMPPRLFRMSAKCLWNVQKAFMAATDSHNENVKQYATTWMNRLDESASFGIRCAIDGIWRPFLFFFHLQEISSVECAECSNVTHVTYTRRAQRLNHEFYYIIHSADLRHQTSICGIFTLLFILARIFTRKLNAKIAVIAGTWYLDHFRAPAFILIHKMRIPNGERWENVGGALPSLHFRIGQVMGEGDV